MIEDFEKECRFIQFMKPERVAELLEQLRELAAADSAAN